MEIVRTSVAVVTKSGTTRAMHHVQAQRLRAFSCAARVSPAVRRRKRARHASTARSERAKMGESLVHV